MELPVVLSAQLDAEVPPAELAGTTARTALLVGLAGVAATSVVEMELDFDSGKEEVVRAE